MTSPGGSAGTVHSPEEFVAIMHQMVTWQQWQEWIQASIMNQMNWPQIMHQLVTWQQWQQWIQASIMNQMNWPRPEEDYVGEAQCDPVHPHEFAFHSQEFAMCVPEFERPEVDIAGEAELHEVDIAGELSRKSSQGLMELEKAVLAADGLQGQLATVKHTFEYVLDTMQFTQHRAVRQLDDLELRTARALSDIDELFRQQEAQEAPALPAVALEHTKLVQKIACDVAVLACSRFISHTILQSKGIKPELLSRLEAAFGHAALQDDGLWSRIGNSKYHIFTNGVRFGERKHRHGRGGRMSRRTMPFDVVEMADDDAPSDRPTVGAEPMKVDVAEMADDGAERIEISEPMFIQGAQGSSNPSLRLLQYISQWDADVGTDGHVIVDKAAVYA